MGEEFGKLLAGLIFGTAVVLGPLFITVVVEIAVAAFFRVGREGLIAVGLVSGVTNPVMNLVVIITYGLAIGFTKTGYSNYNFMGPRIPNYYPAPLWFVILAVAEVVVVIAEWRMLVWVLGERFGSRKLLLLSVVMNAASATLGVVLAVSS